MPQQTEPSLFSPLRGTNSPKRNFMCRKLWKSQSARYSQAPHYVSEKGLPELVSDYIFGDELGRGQFGVVFKVTHKRTGTSYACKKIRKKAMHCSPGTAASDITREVEILKHLSSKPFPHPNLVAVHDVYEDPDNVYVLTELCEGGELYYRIMEKKRFSERRAAKILYELLQAVLYCHQNGVVHRDVKPENIFFVDKTEDSAIKLSDFGISQFAAPGQRFTDFVGSPLYIAPELIAGCHGAEADVWSCGVVLYILLNGRPPFYSRSDSEVIDRISLGQIGHAQEWDKVSDDAKDLVLKLLTMNPKQRPSAAEALRHPWLQTHLSENNAIADALGRLKHFADSHKFKKLSLRIVSQHLTTEEIEKLNTLFNALDQDKDGQVSPKDLEEAVRKAPHSLCYINNDVSGLIQAVDTAKRGCIGREDFIAAVLHFSDVQEEARLVLPFQQFDKDRKGYITMEEIEAAFASAGEKLSDFDKTRIMNESDLNQDGIIDYLEFCIMVASKKQCRIRRRRLSVS